MEPGVWQIIIIVAIIVLLFGAKKIPELAKGVGQGITEFKNATKKTQNQVEETKKNLNSEPVEDNNSEESREKTKTNAE